MSNVTISAIDAGEYDVVVVGGGLSGCCAAIAAARNGAKTLLAEAHSYIGGNGTTGIPLIFYRAYNSTKIVVGGIPLEILRKLEKRGASNIPPEECDTLPIDCELLQIELTHMLDDAGVELLTHAPLLAVEKEGDHITAGIFYSKEGNLRIRGNIFVDSTGDAQVSQLAGLPTPMGRQSDGKTQSMTLVFTLGGIDSKKFPTLNEIKKVWMKLRTEEKNWLNPRDAICEPAAIPGKPGVYAFNVTRILVDKGTDSRQLTQAEKAGRYQIEEFVYRFLKPHIPGCENCYITQIGATVGIRETRRITGLYEMTAADIRTSRKFPDSIACNSYPIDIHSPDGGDTHFEENQFTEGSYYTIPYRSLVAKNVDNLFGAGRCLSASHEALSAVRILTAAMATGEAAGVAGALCTKKKLSPSQLNTDELRSLLKQQRAIVD